MLRALLLAGVVTALALTAPVDAGAAGGLSDDCADRLRGQRLTIAVPNAAGGGYDIYARSLAPVIERLAGVSVRV